MSTSNDKFLIKKINISNRKDGVSGFMRVKNGGDTIFHCVESHIDILDEVLIVYNKCTDNTEEEINRLIRKYPSKIKIIEYEPEVYPIGSELHRKENEYSVHSLVNYYNFSLSNTSYQWCMKLDDDHVLPQRKPGYNFSNVGKDTICYFSGINLAWLDLGTKQEIGVHGFNPYAGNGDHFLFYVDENTFFKKNEICESFHHKKSKSEYIGIRYYHLKYLRDNFGFNNVITTDLAKKLMNELSSKQVLSIEDFKNIAHNLQYFDAPHRNINKILAFLGDKIELKKIMLRLCNHKSIKTQRAICILNEIDQLFLDDEMEKIRGLFLKNS